MALSFCGDGAAWLQLPSPLSTSFHGLNMVGGHGFGHGRRALSGNGKGRKAGTQINGQYLWLPGLPSTGGGKKLLGRDNPDGPAATRIPVRQLPARTRVCHPGGRQWRYCHLHYPRRRNQ